MADGDYERPEKRKAEIDRLKRVLEGLRVARSAMGGLPPQMDRNQGAVEGSTLRNAPRP